MTILIVAFRNSVDRKCQKACLGFDVFLVLDVVAYWLKPGIFVDVGRTKRHPDHSNKSPTSCNNFPVYYPDVHLQLNMFRGVFPPIIRSSVTAVAASGFIFVSW